MSRSDVRSADEFVISRHFNSGRAKIMNLNECVVVVDGRIDVEATLDKCRDTLTEQAANNLMARDDVAGAVRRIFEQKSAKSIPTDFLAMLVITELGWDFSRNAEVKTLLKSLNGTVLTIQKKVGCSLMGAETAEAAE